MDDRIASDEDTDTPVVVDDADSDGLTIDEGDCDDSDARTHPGADEEWYDGVDQDCDGNDGDADGDGFYWSGYAGAVPDGYDGDDCDDEDPERNPDASDEGGGVGDEVDQDCDGREWCYQDADSDGYRTTLTLLSADDDCADEGEATTDAPVLDCDDGRDAVHPGAAELCGDGMDQDCDGEADEDAAVLDGGSERLSFPTVQGALDAASLGDEVTVCPGMHHENLRIEVALTLTGSGGADETTIDGGGVDSTVLVDADATIEGLTITNGDASNYGGGVQVSGGTVEVRSCAVTGNAAHIGGGIAITAGELTVEDTEVSANTGIGIVVYNASLLLVSRSTISGNTGVQAGALWVPSGSVSLVDTDVVDNTSSYGAGGIWVGEADVMLDGGSVRRNEGGGWGEAAVVQAGTMASTGCSWGTGSNDNGTGSDVCLLSSESVCNLYDYGDGATFTCSTDAMLCE